MQSINCEACDTEMDCLEEEELRGACMMFGRLWCSICGTTVSYRRMADYDELELDKWSIPRAMRMGAMDKQHMLEYLKSINPDPPEMGDPGDVAYQHAKGISNAISGLIHQIEHDAFKVGKV